MKIEDKCKTVFSKALCSLGWLPVNSSISRIYLKNSVKLVLYNETDLPAAFSSSEALATGFCKTIHGNLPWYVLHNGFVIADGKMSKFISSTYDLGFESESKDVKDFWDLINLINSYSEMSEDELLLLERKESCISSTETRIVYVPSNKQISETRLFTVNLDLAPSLSSMFKKNVVYYLESSYKTDDGTVMLKVVENGSSKALSDLNFNAVAECLKSGIFTVVEETTQKGDDSYVYLGMFPVDSEVLGSEFNDFKLNAAQKIYASNGKQTGGNFTPLLENFRSPDECKAIVDLIKEDCDVSCLLGKKLSADVIVFLTALAKNGLPISGFCTEDVKVEDLQAKYSNFSATMEQLLPTVAHTSDQKILDAYKVAAFYMNGLSHLTGKNFNKPVEIYLADFVFRNPKFKDLGDYILANGVLTDDTIELSWVDVDSIWQRAALEMFRTDGLEVAGEVLDDYFESSSYNIANLCFTCRHGFELRFSGYRMFVDFNSLALEAGDVLWRAIKVNDKFYVYENSDRFISF